MSAPLSHASVGHVRHLSDTRTFRGVEAWVFDLDNTLYPSHSALFPQIDARISDYVARLLDLDHAAARAVQKSLYREYGTTLRGLMQAHDVDPDDFLRYVHDIDYSPLRSNPELGCAIAALPGRRFIFTNGDRPHAERTARALGIEDHFEDIFDIVAAELMPKPNRETYERFVSQTGVSPARTAMFEDLSHNLEVPHALGMRTVLIVPHGTREVFRGSWDLESDNAKHIDFVTDDLTGFLRQIAGGLASPSVAPSRRKSDE